MSRTILVVDDEPDIREVVRMSLEAVSGWRVLAAGSGPEGVDLGLAQRPDAILLDFMMPGLDGPATLAMLRERERELGSEPLPVVMMTAKTQGFGPEGAEAYGAQGLIVKPFDPMTLGGQIAAVLGWD